MKGMDQQLNMLQAFGFRSWPRDRNSMMMKMCIFTKKMGNTFSKLFFSSKQELSKQELYQIALKKVLRDGFRRRGNVDPSDQCMEAKKPDNKYPVHLDSGTIHVIGYGIACEAMGRSKSGEPNEHYSHVCGRMGCLNGRHLKVEDEKINWERRLICHQLIHDWIEDNKGNLSGIKVPPAMCGFVCHHDMTCFYIVR